MKVLKYNSNGFPLYWIDTDSDSPTFLKLFKRIDKNASQLIEKFPKFLIPAILQTWEEYLIN